MTSVDDGLSASSTGQGGQSIRTVPHDAHQPTRTRSRRLRLGLSFSASLILSLVYLPAYEVGVLCTDYIFAQYTEPNAFPIRPRSPVPVVRVAGISTTGVTRVPPGSQPSSPVPPFLVFRSLAFPAVPLRLCCSAPHSLPSLSTLLPPWIFCLPLLSQVPTPEAASPPPKSQQVNRPQVASHRWNQELRTLAMPRVRIDGSINDGGWIAVVLLPIHSPCPGCLPKVPIKLSPRSQVAIIAFKCSSVWTGRHLVFLSLSPSLFLYPFIPLLFPFPSPEISSAFEILIVIVNAKEGYVEVVNPASSCLSQGELT
ncbi:hypothetical protein SODALDRAFT_363052 [Sodiomyces alkalinus F11]|uniref:Uncharacterized protein n=1 Tax=Sodiomyces alkalinus (strain CBS 110278 / VKM F-3762 / F11) TaxID=1314773 RepID=A0A3N2PP27_SODAK|nr:hypothetical protein SODALDRAFT_363052 [Sodiomyces alkalinus F11]ROT36190.1 hypothetical protein SODALDRAFT_363052 [Sodiomyces alkalinus F11]